MANFTEADATQPTNPNEIPRIPKDLKLISGDDTFSISSLGLYSVVGGKGVNTLKIDYSKITVNYGIRNSSELPNNPAFTNKARSGAFYTSEKAPSQKSGGNLVRFSGIYKFDITGTKFDDHLRGAEYKDTLIGGAGNDILYAYPGEGDILDGGDGTDLLIADFSSVNQSQSIFNKDTCTLSNGTTITNIEAFYLKTGSKDDNIDLTGDYDDVISTGSAKDRISTGGGNDKLDGGKDNDILIGGNGNDYLDGSSGNDTLIGVNPQAGLPGQGEIDTLIGGIGKDRYSLGAGGARGKVYYLGNSGTVPALTEITVDQIIAIMPSANRNLVEKYIAPLNQAMKEFNITTAVRQQAFLAQIAVETGEFKDLIELGKKDNPGRGVLQLTETSPNSATGYTNYEFIGDYVEEVISGKDIVVKQVVHKNEKNVKIVDNIKTVDGQKVGKTLGDKVRANPNLILEDPLLGCRMSAAYFDLWGCNQLADQSITDKKTDKGEFYQISQIINLGPNDKKVPLAADKRYDYFKKAQGIIKVPGWSYLYDTDYAILENFDPLQDKIVVSGESKYSKDLGQVDKVGISNKSGQFANYDLVKNQIMLGSNSANPIFNGKTKTVSIAYDLDGSGGLSDADDIIAVITGTDNFGVGSKNTGILDAITFA
jgi:Ca2+-binding RTX toxin-like protein